MFAPIEGGSTTRRAGPSRSNEPPKKWNYVKTFYYDPVKWNFIKSITVFGVAVYFIRDLASNDVLPME